MKGRALGAFLLALPVATGSLLFGAKKTEAAAASFGAREGVNGSDIVVDNAAGACPVVVENETLTFYIADLPETQEEAEQSASRVEAAYLLRNPTGEAVTLTLYLPVGFKPGYLSALPERTRYSVTVETDAGTQFPALKTRYTYHERSYYGMTFDADGELPRADRNDETFFRADMTVTEYTYTVDVSADEQENCTFTFAYDANPLRTRVFSAENGASGVNNGWGEIYRSVQAGRTEQIVVYAIGEEPEVRAGVYSMSGASAQLVSEVAAPQKRTLTFEALVQELYAEARESLGGEDVYLDFYNAAVAMLSHADADYRFASSLNASAVRGNLMLWYEYELTIPAEASVTNVVSAPLMPDLPSQSDGSWNFGYLLSPGHRWASFRNIQIDVETEYYIDNSTLQFTRREGGYSYSKEGLPLGELTFSVTRTERAGYDPFPYDGRTPTLTTALIILAVAVGVAVVSVTAVLIVRANGKKKLRAEEERVSRGRAEEGKVDLDPFPEVRDGPERKDGEKKE